MIPGLDIPDVPVSSSIVPIYTRAESLRMTMAAILKTFGDQELSGITATDMEINAAAVDFDNPKASLFRHPVIPKSIKIIAVNAALSQSFELRNYDRLFFDKYVAEYELEISQTIDNAHRQKLENSLSAAKIFHLATPGCRAELLDSARILRRNVDFCMRSHLNACGHLVAEWLEFLPGEAMRRFQSELQRLATASLQTQMAWFGIADFAPAGELPEN